MHVMHTENLASKGVGKDLIDQQEQSLCLPTMRKNLRTGWFALFDHGDPGNGEAAPGQMTFYNVVCIDGRDTCGAGK
jgi:hypothetical protein